MRRVFLPETLPFFVKKAAPEYSAAALLFKEFPNKGNVILNTIERGSAKIVSTALKDLVGFK
jgi:hypothetical protein